MLFTRTLYGTTVGSLPGVVQDYWHMGPAPATEADYYETKALTQRKSRNNSDFFSIWQKWQPREKSLLFQHLR